MTPTTRRTVVRALVVVAGVACVLLAWWALGLDGPVHDWVVTNRPASLTRSVVVVTNFGSWPAIVGVAIVVTIGVGVRTHDGPATICVPLAVALAELLHAVLAPLIGRHRPPEVDKLIIQNGKSFPSGHSMASSALYVSTALLVPRLIPGRWARPVQGLLIVVPLAVGLSRVWLGVHWPLDVLAGWALGSAVAFGCWVWLGTAAARRRGRVRADDAGAAGADLGDEVADRLPEL